MNNKAIITVTARKITDIEERLLFMPKYFGQFWHIAESHTYGWMRKLSPKNESEYLSNSLDKIEAHYDGGEWDFYELSNGGYFIAPNSREHYRISVSGNYFDGLLSADTAGMVATAFMLGQLCHSDLPIAERCIAYHHKLFDYACCHEEYNQFRAAID
ncbi:TPA: antirestriction protein [Salmonella enterica subsp. enterica serovar 16:l,v:-]|nr:antirestriction protein [Salmonella enterica]